MPTYCQISKSRLINESRTAASRETGRMTVVVQDNGSLHTSHLTRQQWQRWRSQGLFLFFLPPEPLRNEPD